RERGMDDLAARRRDGRLPGRVPEPGFHSLGPAGGDGRAGCRAFERVEHRRAGWLAKRHPRAAAVAACAVGLLSLSRAALAVPTAFAFGDVPSRFQSLELTAGSRALGELCWSRLEMPDGTICNPAFLPEKQESTLIGRVFLGNGYTAVSTADQFVFQP